jgi:hypothetical protein
MRAGYSAFDILNTQSTQQISGTSLYNSQSRCIQLQNTKSSISFVNNVFANCLNQGFATATVPKLQFSNNLMVGLTIDPSITDKLVVAGFSLLSSSGTDYQIFNNVIKGINGIGFLYKGYDCGDSAQK